MSSTGSGEVAYQLLQQGIHILQEGDETWSDLYYRWYPEDPKNYGNSDWTHPRRRPLTEQKEDSTLVASHHPIPTSELTKEEEMTTEQVASPVPVESTPVPPLHLIPTVALERIAERFQKGVERKGDGAWNATTPNQAILMDKQFLIERLSHVVRHALLLRDQLTFGVVEGDESLMDNASAMAWGGVFAICAIQQQFGENK